MAIPPCLPFQPALPTFSCCIYRWLNPDDNPDVHTHMGFDGKTGGRKSSYCKMDVKCKGATGKYLQIILPGANRIFSARVVPNRIRPKLAAGQEGALACYGVEGRAVGPTSPEFVTTDDPEDMMFYSTCYVENNPRDFDETGQEIVPPPPGYKFHGLCLDCDSYKANNGVVPMYQSRFWEITDFCVECNSLEPFPVNPRAIQYSP